MQVWTSIKEKVNCGVSAVGKCRLYLNTLQNKCENQMLVCGRVNPPPVEKNGVFFGVQDNFQDKAKSLKGLPLQVEHNSKCRVGKVISGWVSPEDGAMWALAEINTCELGGAVAAAAVEKGCFNEFSLGYKAQMFRNPMSGSIEVGNKDILELSIVKKGARDGCKIMYKEKK